MSDNKTPWWTEEYGFFGDFYMEGDNSNEGYLIETKQTLAERTAMEVDGIVRLMQLKDRAAILDVPCGYGRHSIELAKRGYVVTGSDINSVHLAKAEYSAKAEGVHVTFHKENMLSISYTEEFDALTNMFYSFGFFETDEENFAVLKNFYRALKSDGRFLMHTDVNVPRIIAGKYKEDETRNLQSGQSLRIIDTYDSKTKRIHGSWEIMGENGKRVKKDYSVRVYTKEEFTDLCLQAGFTTCESFADWKGAAYVPEAEDMIIVATK
jgi:cyclopropane fatty-acyl-phospholipid synthase-like methyltransferase